MSKSMYLGLRIAIYALISLLIIINLGLKGYLFLLDWTPALAKWKLLRIVYGLNPPIYGGSLPLTLLSILIPANVFQRFAIFMILFLSGLSMDLLVGRFTNSALSKLFAGILYMLNPYTYIRILVGHWVILLSYSILPLGILTYLDLLEKRNVESAMKFALVQILIGFNAHTFLISIFVYLIISSIYIHDLIKSIKHLILSIFIFLLLATYWIVPLLTFKGETLLKHIGIADLKVFAPKGSFFELMAMYGFWRLGYVYAKDLLPFWPMLFLIIFGLTTFGFVRRIDRITLSFMLIWIIGFALASGVRGPFSSVLTPLFEHTILKGMRDSHKFVTMLCLSYSFLGALGLEEIERLLRNKKPLVKIGVVSVILLVPLIYSFTFFNGFAGQIKPCDFPKDWYEVKAFLDKDKDNFRVLFFPWHLYMTFHWLPNRDKCIANPAPLFFDKDVISAKNIEIPGVYTEVYTPYQRYVEFLLSKRNKIKNFGKLVSILGVKYILLTKEVDYKNYFFLFNQTDLELVMETKNFYVFKNKAFKGLMFSVNGIAYVKNWNELIKISKTKDIIKRLYLIGNGREEGNESCKRLNFVKESPVKYVTKDKPLKYIIFTEEYSKDWKLNGEEPIKAYGIVNAYIVKGSKPVEIVYERFYKVCLPSYIASAVTFLCLLCYQVKSIWKR